ncbi:MAG: sigma 54-interacting transcriptional regulator [Sphingomonadaceae bacterium]|uniref:sigma 54-interacting transcriptional regulator n=1 Tax=Thermaurantiacus sp. TaxID=2820283 RepID=UPI00298F29D8|nr:sigma 54-interacting transcriptional regulator [Thermaurantiacus sp.]MCS6987015.1 sigma 54-interacting transcriptional regulator [Sphingomonadaceae bacterium]MDW8415647.1 sigma 54-interacting transcriptional regulator [Thermaurantiacus sp.]
MKLAHAPHEQRPPTSPPAATAPPALVAALASAGLRPPRAIAPDSPLQRSFHAAILAAVHAGPGPVAVDPLSRALLAEAERVAASGATVLVTGPSGSGKEVLARFIHDRSPRAARPFLAINCAALPEAMLEALLFGHERGAFTGAHGAAPGLFRSADGGTLFLDEVGELPLSLQAKLLRAVQEREVLPLGGTRPIPVDVRLIAATNRDLARDCAHGRFREDLFWRLSVFPLATLPLASRPLDIVPLAAALLVRLARADGQPLVWMADDALEALTHHRFPGNVRELDNLLQRASILAGGGPITAACLRFDRPPGADPADIALPGRADGGLVVQLKTREAEAIRAALAATGGRKALAARRLGISERTLRYKLAELAGRPRRPAPAAGAQEAAR